MSMLTGRICSGAQPRQSRCSAIGDEDHPAFVSVGSQRHVRVTASARGPIDGQRLDLAVVGQTAGDVHVALAHRQHPVGRRPDDASHRGKRHLQGQHEDQRLEQQCEAVKAAGEIRLIWRTAPWGRRIRGMRTRRRHSCWKKFRCR